MASPAAGAQREEDSFRVLEPRIGEALRFMKANLHHCSLTVADIASHAGLSRSGFSRLFRVETKSSPKRTVLRMRMQLAGELLSARRAYPLKEVAARAGIPRLDVFARTFREWFGVTPSEFQRSRRYVRGQL
ncbi:MAG: AraC family transcriptional regulator [Bryobacteraceae bacterium]|jgi:AraC-like DNA-binding protein